VLGGVTCAVSDFDKDVSIVDSTHSLPDATYYVRIKDHSSTPNTFEVGSRASEILPMCSLFGAFSVAL
jgi:hypothetical protein